MSILSKKQKYYDNKWYDAVYKDLMIDDKHTEIPKNKYYEDDPYNGHFQNVHAGIDDHLSFPTNIRYYEDKDMNELFIDKFIKDTLENVSTPEQFKAALNDVNVKSIKLLDNLTMNEQIKIINGRELNIDLGNKKLTYTANGNLVVGGENNTTIGTGGTLTFSNGTLDLGTKGLRVYANNSKTDRDTVINSKLVLGEGCNVVSTSSSAIAIMGKGAELYANKNCGTIQTSATDAGLIMGNGNSQCGGTKIVIDGGTFKLGNDSGSIVIYHPQDGQLIINGGTFEGADGIQLKAGVTSIASISNATIKGTYETAVDPATIPDSSNGSVVTGSAISLIGNSNYSGSMSLTIDGNVKLESVKNPALLQAVANNETNPNIEKVLINNGDFVGKGFNGTNKALLIKNYNTLQDKIDVNGGTYNSDVTEYIKPAFECVEIETGKYKVKKK